MTTLRPGIQYDTLAQTIQDLRNGLTTVRRPDKYETLNNYLSWATNAGTALRPVMSRTDVNRIVLSPAYWALLGVDPAANEAVLHVVNAELSNADRELKALDEEIKQKLGRWRSLIGTVLVPDTNVLLEHVADFDDLPWASFADPKLQGPVHVVFPMLVIDELDKAKADRVRSRARNCLRSINRLFPDPLQPATAKDPSGRSATLRLFIDPSTHQRIDDPDLEIADRAAVIGDMVGFPSRIVTFDTGMALRCRAQHLDVNLLDDQERRPEGKRP